MTILLLLCLLLAPVEITVAVSDWTSKRDPNQSFVPLLEAGKKGGAPQSSNFNASVEAQQNALQNAGKTPNGQASTTHLQKAAAANKTATTANDTAFPQGSSMPRGFILRLTNPEPEGSQSNPVGVNPIPQTVNGTPLIFTRPEQEVNIRILDDYSDKKRYTPDQVAQLRFTDDEISLMLNSLPKYPPRLLQSIQWIVTRHVTEDTKEFTAFANSRGIVFLVDVSPKPPARRSLVHEGTFFNLKDFLGVLGHEIGHHIQQHALTPEEKDEFRRLHHESKNPAFDTVETFFFFRPEFYADGTIRPYGDTNQFEDFATLSGNVTNNTRKILAEAIRRAKEGQPMLLRKLLFVLSAFADSASHTVPFYVAQPELKRLDAVQQSLTRTRNSLVIGEFRFVIRNRAIVATLEGDSKTGFTRQDLPVPAPLPETFLTRVPIAK